MAARGAYTKGIAKREEILTAALAIVARDGYRKTTVRELADAVGLSQTGLLHYFGTKEQLYIEILRRRDELDAKRFMPNPEDGKPPAAMPETVVDLVRHNADVPGFVQLYSRFSSEAAEADHPAHEYFRERYLIARRMMAVEIERLGREGRVPPDVDAERLSIMLLAVLDGLQMQWMYDPEVDMADHVGYFWELLSRLAQAENPKRS